MSYEDGMPAGGNSRFRGYPARMSERQQLALLLQMTSQETLPSSGTGGNRTESIGGQSTSRSPSLQHSQRGTKSRWTNKNGDLPIGHALQNRKDDCRGRTNLNGCESNAKEANEAATTNNPEETTLVRESSRSPSQACDNNTTNDERNEEESNASDNCQSRNNYQNQQRPSESSLDATTLVAEDSGAPCEMRRTSPQNKVDRSGTGQSGSSPRVTLRLNQVRSSRDEKKSGPGNLRQGVSSAASQGQMENSTKTPTSGASSSASSPSVSTIGITGNALSSSAASGHGNAGCGVSGAGVGTNSSTSETGDVYEFKSSKEATPVRGASISPNPEKDNDKEKESAKSSSGGQSQGTGNSPASGSVAPTTSTETTTTTSSSSSGTGTESHASASPSSKRSYEGDNADEQEDENRRKKRKETEVAKEATKGQGSGRQNAGRNTTGTGDKCAKTGKQSSGGGVTGKSNQGATAANPDRKSPGATSAASSSPKPSVSASSTATNSKSGATAPTESDGEEDRPKSSDSGSAPKVPPLKIVIPQSTTSEQEVGARNGKSTTNRSHQLPYVVPSSNSNDSTDKDQNSTASGTTSPTEVNNATKTEDKKDFTGVLHNEERSTHHQRVLRSSHRSGNGGNGSTTAKDSSSSTSANGNYSHSSPAPATSSTDRSNNSSPQQQQAPSQAQQPVQPQQSPRQEQEQEQQQQEQEQKDQQQSQRHNSPSPETTNVDACKTTTTDSTPSSSGNNGNGGTANATKQTNATLEKTEKSSESNGKSQKDGGDSSETSSSSVATTTNNTSGNATAPVELHPRKRKMKPSKEAQQAAATASANESSETTNAGPEVHPHDQPITNCYQLFLNIRKQIERRRKGLFPVQPKPPQGFKDYLMNRCTYVLAGNANKEPNINPPVALQGPMKDLYVEQEKERYRLRMQHVVEKEKLVLSVEQEILRVHGRAARALANQSLPFSVCTILKDEEVYNVITPEQEEKDRNARSRYNGRLFLSWLQDVDDKWEKIKEAMLLRHHNEAESLHAVQRMDWEWKLKEVGLCEFKATPQIEDLHVPMVHVSDDFDLLPA